MRFKQSGQSMVEYTVVLVFGVLVFTTGPGANVLTDLYNVMQSNYRGYSYALSVSEYPDHDSLGAFLLDSSIADKLDPTTVIPQLTQFTQFPTLQTMPTGFPTSPADLLDGATSFFPP
jgi:hypothetical protein